MLDERYIYLANNEGSSCNPTENFPNRNNALCLWSATTAASSLRLRYVSSLTFPKLILALIVSILSVLQPLNIMGWTLNAMLITIVLSYCLMEWCVVAKLGTDSEKVLPGKQAVVPALSKHARRRREPMWGRSRQSRFCSGRCRMDYDCPGFCYCNSDDEDNSDYITLGHCYGSGTG